jgi:hypothetical protein
MSALDTWIEKRNFLEEELAKASDAAQKFSLLKGIEEAKRKIAELGGEPRVEEPARVAAKSDWNWASLAGPHLRQLHEAMMASFNQDQLRQLTRFQLDQSYEDIVRANANNSAAVFDLLEWAEANGKLKQLFEAAINQNPDNPLLRAIREQSLG